jgi:eukaryotic-like serine/threonine-protein kinase
MPHRVSSGDDPYLGRVLDQHFRVDAAIGSGAMARVYRAHQLGVGRDVALKILRRELLERTDIVARFRSEAELVGRLVHPHVVAVYATGEVRDEPTGPEREPFVVLEWLEGLSLAQLLDQTGGCLPLARALHIVLALCDAVGEAHSRGIVHRDLKPENVMLVHRGDDPDFVKLLDFGLARVLHERADPRTRAGAILGTPRYVSPEGAEGLPVTPASDCYSLSTLLYQCLAGRTPFEAESAVALLAQHTAAAPPDLRAFAPAAGVAEPIARVIMKNLEKRPEQRASDARAFGRELVAAARSAGLDALEFGLSSTLLGTRRNLSPVALTHSAPVTQHTEAVLPRPAAPRASNKRSLARAALFVACFLMGIFAAVAIISRQNGPSPSPLGTAP